MIKNFIDLDIKYFDTEDFSVGCSPEDPSNHYYLRFRYFYPEGYGTEYEIWCPTLSNCIFKLILCLTKYAVYGKD